MAPAALAIPQYTNAADSHYLRDSSSEWDKDINSNNMDSALDFDLLAEYLLEDVGAGGFDFSNPEVVSPPTIDAPKTQPTLFPQDPGVVTPHQSDTSFVDPLADVAALLQQPQQVVGGAPLPANGDLAGELSQVQQMMATTQQQQQQAKPSLAPAAPQFQQQQQPRPLSQPAAPSNNGMLPIRQQQQPKPAPVPAQINQRPPMAKNGMVPSVAQPNKRPRVSAPPNGKGPSYSFASSNMGGAPAPRPGGNNGILPPSAQQGLGNNRQKSQAQIDRRRERNRILARRTRLRKKFFFESLQKDVADLQRENAALKSIVRSRLKPDDARIILNQCNANEKLPSAIHAEAGEAGLGPMGGIGGSNGAGDPGVKKLDKEDFSLIQSIQNSQQCFIITDPSLHDNPIVYASDDFLTLTGYSQEEVLGRNCRFLQGTETCREKVAKIRKAVQVGEDVNVTFVNYTSDGKPFWNSLFIAALRDADNNIVNFIGVIVKVAGPEPGDSEYGKVLK